MDALAWITLAGVLVSCATMSVLLFAVKDFGSYVGRIERSNALNRQSNELTRQSNARAIDRINANEAEYQLKFEEALSVLNETMKLWREVRDHHSLYHPLSDKDPIP